MNIKEYVARFNNHPVLFFGTGMSLRYLNNSYTWDGLLDKISFELKGNKEYYYDVKSSCYDEGKYKYEKVAEILEKDFNASLMKDRDGKFKEINDIFYENMKNGICLSRFKIYIAKLLKSLDYRNKENEILALKKVRKNVSSIITTNYDKMIEDIFEFNPLVGNNILLSNPYGSLYKIHGCVSEPNKIIITSDDYENFKQKYELIRAQLLSIFIHNPIIFFGYNIGDENIKSLLKTIFTYVEPNSDEADKVRANFLLVEYEEGLMNNDVTEHDIDVEGFSTIRINKIKTDDYETIYGALAELQLPVSAMDIRKVQTVVKEIYEGGNIKVSITDDLDNLRNSDKVIAIGSKKTITYSYQTYSEVLNKYFTIIEEANSQILDLIDKFKIQSQQFFPIYGFERINNNIKSATKLRQQQELKLKTIIERMEGKYEITATTIEEILGDDKIAASFKVDSIVYAVLKRKVDVDLLEIYLKDCENEDRRKTDYKKMLCAYDYMKYAKM